MVNLILFFETFTNISPSVSSKSFLNSLTVFLGIIIDGIPFAPSGSLSLT